MLDDLREPPGRGVGEEGQAETRSFAYLGRGTSIVDNCPRRRKNRTSLVLTGFGTRYAKFSREQDKLQTCAGGSHVQR
jgi:hypothetical protein